jgi:SNF2 family DNA or RNA helicase
MGLGSGKSLVALARAETLRARRVLITADKNNVINTWPDEIYRHTDFKCVVRPVDLSKLSFDCPTCVLTNYEMLAANPERYRLKWDFWIGDESSEFKDQRTLKHKMLRSIVQAADNRLILNGRLMTERLEDVWPQVNLIDHRNLLGRTLTQFRQRYMRPDDWGYGWIPQRSAFTRVQRDMFGLGYFLEDVPNMPEKHYINVPVGMTDEQRRIDNELRSAFASAFAGAKVETRFAAAAFIKRLQLAGGIFRGDHGESRPVPTRKMAALLEILRDNADHKIVVWHTYIPETGLISDFLRAKAIPHLVFDAPEKSDVLLRFSEREDEKVLLIRTSMCRGLNRLVGADLAVHWSNPLAYARRAQAEGRSCRITSGSRDVYYFDLTTEGGADTIVHRQLQQKQNCSLTFSGLYSILQET